jgi:kumamolisin
MPVHVPLPGSDRTLLPNSRLVGAVDRRELVTLTVAVRSQSNPEELERWVREQAAKPPAERTYLTRQQLREQHGASTEDLDAVEGFGRHYDLQVVHRSAAERSVVLRGQLGDLLAAFPADLRMYHHAQGTYRGRQGQIQVPQELRDIVTGVFGYDTRPRRRSSGRRQHLSDNGPGGANGVAATVFAARYEFPAEAGGQPLTGAGETIAIIELGGGYRTSDLRAYFTEIGRPLPQVTAVSVDHGGNHPATADSADGEVMLDLEVAGAVAPGATLAVYFAPNSDKGFLDAISAAVHDAERRPSVVSISWGSPENAADVQGLRAYHQVFVEAAALGVTICAAAGDHGAADEPAPLWDKHIHVDHPAADDLVLACGGTQINDFTEGGGGEEVVWNDGTPFDPGVPGGGGWTTGGGISTLFAVPDYQQNLTLPASVVPGAGPGRGVPDIAMSATNYFVRVDRAEGASGGTSAVAPLMAGLVALLNQALPQYAGYLNPFLYANAGKGLFRDITQGSNAIPGSAAGYQATVGWDACTGLGTPVGTALLAALSAPPD